MSPLIERPQAEREVNRRRGVERGIDERNSPPPDVPGQPGIHGGVGDVAERMNEEMRKNVREHDEAASKAHLAHANAPQPRCFFQAEDGIRDYKVTSSDVCSSD